MHLFTMSRLLLTMALVQVVLTCSDRPRLFFHQRTSVSELDTLTEPKKSLVSLSDVSREFLTCRASQNVEWIYEGNGVCVN